MFSLVVDDFRVECVGKDHIEHLSIALEEYCEITADWKGGKFLGTDLDWNYSQETMRLLIKNYIMTIL